VTRRGRPLLSAGHFAVCRRRRSVCQWRLGAPPPTANVRTPAPAHAIRRTALHRPMLTMWGRAAWLVGPRCCSAASAEERHHRPTYQATPRHAAPRRGAAGPPHCEQRDGWARRIKGRLCTFVVALNGARHRPGTHHRPPLPRAVAAARSGVSRAALVRAPHGVQAGGRQRPAAPWSRQR